MKTKKEPQSFAFGAFNPCSINGILSLEGFTLCTFSGDPALRRVKYSTDLTISGLGRS